MKKTLPIIIILLILLVGGCNSYNGMNGSKAEVDNTWAQVQSNYQRRADLIPNLVATVKGAADFEKNTYVQVAQARAGQLKNLSNVPADSLTPSRMAQIQQASSDAQKAASMAIHIAVESYPQLKASQNFSDLQNQLEGTENRINTSRDKFNDAVKNYNLKVSNFPAKLWASLFGFNTRAMFQADPGSQNAPKVSF